MPWCHLFLMMPIFGLAVFLVLPVGAAAPIYLMISAISLLIYTKLVKALHAPVAVGREGMIGGEALAASSLHPKGVVRYRGALWTATCSKAVSPGERVRILAVDRTSLAVEACREGRRIGPDRHPQGDPVSTAPHSASHCRTSAVERVWVHRKRRHTWPRKTLTT